MSHSDTLSVTISNGCQVSIPWNDDSVLVVLQFEAEGVLLGVQGGGNADACLRLLNVFHELKVQI